jgi:hypothetical protein
MSISSWVSKLPFQLDDWNPTYWELQTKATRSHSDDPADLSHHIQSRRGKPNKRLPLGVTWRGQGQLFSSILRPYVVRCDSVWKRSYPAPDFKKKANILSKRGSHSFLAPLSLHELRCIATPRDLLSICKLVQVSSQLHSNKKIDAREIAIRGYKNLSFNDNPDALPYLIWNEYRSGGSQSNQTDLSGTWKKLYSLILSFPWFPCGNETNRSLPLNPSTSKANYEPLTKRSGNPIKSGYHILPELWLQPRWREIGSFSR